MSKPKTVRLTQPIAWDGKTVTEVQVRRPKVKDLRAMEQDNSVNATQIDQGVAMAALLTELPVEIIDEMDAVDFAALSEVIAGFLPEGPAPATGAAL
ncbi:MAG: phage tail assembly protein [Rhizobiales bacterium]|mgnify:CR=1 FL=1|nr:phage tail assembly protein [Hyphomicrobiales bacterium]